MSSKNNEKAVKKKLFDKKVKVHLGKKDFPLLKKNKSLIYFDSAATTQKPNYVLKKYIEYYKNYNSNIHRGLYDLSEKSSLIYKYSRENIGNFLHVKEKEIVFTKGATDSINQISKMLSPKCESMDEILIIIDQHHSNLIPWQKLAKEKDLILKYVFLNEDYQVDVNNLLEKVTKKTKIVTFNHVSNVTGKIHPVKEIIKSIKKKRNEISFLVKEENGNIIEENNRIYFVVDGAQAMAHIELNLKDLDVDFYSFSGHKMYAPFGIGGFFIKEDLHNLEPSIFGGDAIEDVKMNYTKFLEAPQKYEPGTQNIAGAYALSCAVDYIKSLRDKEINKNEMILFNLLYDKLSKIDGINIIGNKKDKISLLTFSHNFVHSHDLAYYLSTCNIAVRSGMHCAYPFYEESKLKSSVRVSIGIYNTKKDVIFLIEKINDAILEFKK